MPESRHVVCAPPSTIEVIGEPSALGAGTKWDSYRGHSPWYFPRHAAVAVSV